MYIFTIACLTAISKPILGLFREFQEIVAARPHPFRTGGPLVKMGPLASQHDGGPGKPATGADRCCRGVSFCCRGVPSRSRSELTCHHSGSLGSSRHIGEESRGLRPEGSEPLSAKLTQAAVTYQPATLLVPETVGE